ncbi:MAG: diacylglycerol kinase family lipid kinase [Aerococcus sp.]|nr:diacylglycerol kinase family lipid kinase [Aerococcus sp.]
MKEAWIIANPGSGNNQGEAIASELKAHLAPHFDEVTAHYTKEAHDGTKFAKAASEAHVHSLFVVGGDGTIHEAINGLGGADYRPTVGFLPGGTNNTFAKLFNMPMDMQQAIESLDLEHTAELEIGKCNDSYFFYYASFGKLIEATTGTSSEEKSKWGPLAYLHSILHALPNDESRKIRVTTDNGDYEEDASLVYCMLTNKIGNLTIGNETGSLQDGKMHIVIAKSEMTSTKLSALFDLAVGNLENNEDVTLITCSEATIEASDGDTVEIDLDGNVEEALPIQLTLLPDHIEYYLPKQVNEEVASE